MTNQRYIFDHYTPGKYDAILLDILESDQVETAYHYSWTLLDHHAYGNYNRQERQELASLRRAAKQRIHELNA